MLSSDIYSPANEVYCAFDFLNLDNIFELRIS